MKLTSIEFACFAGALVALYYRIPGRYQWKLLLAASTLFYLRGGWQTLGYLAAASGSVFLAAGKMEQNKASMTRPEARKRNRKWLLLCLGLDLGMLFFCKARLLTGKWLLPLGISFYTFQMLGYLIDVYRGKTEGQGDFWKFHLFASWFPLLVQGPICRYDQLAPQLLGEREFDGRQVSFGFQRMLWGYFKKLVVADRLAPAVAALRQIDDSGAAFFLLSLLYAVEIYADFTGGIDVVLGFSQALGMELPENFDLPFSAKSVAEFWRRWHITLGEWMKDYIFYPVSVSRPMLRLGRYARQRWGSWGKRLPVCIATILTWGATGLWHGLTPNFLVWGMMNCGVILLSQMLPARLHLPQGKRWDRFRMVRTFLLMNCIRVCDLFPDPGDYFGRMLARPNMAALTGALPLTLADWGILAFGIALMCSVSRFQSRGGSVRRWLGRQKQWVRWGMLFGLILLVLLLGRYGVGYEASNFIYNQF